MKRNLMTQYPGANCDAIVETSRKENMKIKFTDFEVPDISDNKTEIITSEFTANN